VPILNAFVTNIPNQMMSVDQQLARSQKAVLNAFVTNIPIQMMPLYLPDRQVAGSWYAVLMTPVELPDRQLAGSRYAVLDAFVTYLSAGRSGLCRKIAKQFVAGYAGFKIIKCRSRLCRKIAKKKS
jgi:hypothetical protein